MERCNSSCMARKTTSWAWRPMEASRRPKATVHFMPYSPSLVIRGWSQNGRALLRFLFFLGLDLRNQNGRSAGGDRHTSGFCATDAVEYRDIVCGGDDLAEDGQWRADEVHAAHQFLSPVRVDPVHHDRQHVEGVGDGAAGECEPALDVVEQQSIRFVFFFDLLDQQIFQFLPGNRFRRYNLEVRLARNRGEAGLCASVAVGGGKAFDGAARHQKILQDSVFNRGHPAGPDPFIIKAVGPDPVTASEFPYGP